MVKTYRETICDCLQEDDPHAALARKIFNTPEVSHEERVYAKTVLMAYLYGSGGPPFDSELQVERNFEEERIAARRLVEAALGIHMGLGRGLIKKGEKN